MRLHQLPRGETSIIIDVAWSDLPPDDARRLRGLGVEAGAEVELLHRGILFWGDPLAVRINRMTVAMRKSHAAAISCGEPEQA